MALVNCPECGKEISDKAGKCPYCGYPIGGESDVQINKEVKKKKNILPLLLGIIVIVVVGTLVYNYAVLQPKKIAEQNAIYEKAMKQVDKREYDEAIELLYTIPKYENIETIIADVEKEKETFDTYNSGIGYLETGKYAEGIELLNKISDYSDVAQVLNEAKYESYAYSAVSAVKSILKNPDSLSVYEVHFYENDGEDAVTNAEGEKYPYVIMHIGAQNGFGGNTTSYAGFTYDNEKRAYTLETYTDTLDTEELDEDDEDYFVYYLSALVIKSKLDNGEEIGAINFERFNNVLKSSAYTAVKIIG